jgi:ABC-type molybdate transport system substrate-binding protein
MRIFVILALLTMSPNFVLAYAGSPNIMGCKMNCEEGDYNCHRVNNSFNKSQMPNKSKLTKETAFNQALALLLSGRTEVLLSYNYGNSVNTSLTASVRIDIVTDEYVIEGGLDKRSSLDSIQQAVFASVLSGKAPAVAVYDTDGLWGKYEHRIWTVANELGIKFYWFDGTKLKLK